MEQNPVGEKVIAALKKRYPEIKGVNDIVAPVGTANAYDATMLAALAINKAGSTNGEKIREAFYEIPEYKGLIKTYKKPFSAESQDALTDRDYIWVHFVGNAAVPVN